MRLSEIAIMNPHLTKTQQTVLCRIFIAPTSTIAYEQTQDTPNTIEARKQLANMGMVRYDEVGGVEITDDGTRAMEREYLVDETGELTQQAQDLIDDDITN